MSGDFVTVSWLIDGPKISAYLLNIDHPRGGPKAKYLLGFGFTQTEPRALADALVDHAMSNLPGTLKPQEAGLHRVVFEGGVVAPDGRTMPLRSVWEVSERGTEREMRFLTAVPLTR